MSSVLSPDEFQLNLAPSNTEMLNMSGETLLVPRSRRNLSETDVNHQILGTVRQDKRSQFHNNSHRATNRSFRSLPRTRSQCKPFQTCAITLQQVRMGVHDNSEVFHRETLDRIPVKSTEMVIFNDRLDGETVQCDLITKGKILQIP